MFITNTIFTQESSYANYGIGWEEARLDLRFWNMHFPYSDHCTVSLIWEKLLCELLTHENLLQQSLHEKALSLLCNS